MSDTKEVGLSATDIPYAPTWSNTENGEAKTSDGLRIVMKKESHMTEDCKGMDEMIPVG